MASEYCYGREMKVALERHEKGEARVIPILIHPVEPPYPVVERRAPFRSRTTGFLDSRVLDTCCR